MFVCVLIKNTFINQINPDLAVTVYAAAGAAGSIQIIPVCRVTQLNRLHHHHTPPYIRHRSTAHRRTVDHRLGGFTRMSTSSFMQSASAN